MVVERQVPSWVTGLEAPQPQDLVVSLLGTYVHGRNTRVWSGGLVRLLADFGFTHGASRVALSRLVRRELLRPVKRGRTVHYEVTDRLARALDEGRDRIFNFGRGSRTGRAWTVVWHTIPEDLRAERRLFARRLRFFGFGSIQPGTWVVPHDREAAVAALVRELGVTEHAVFFVGRLGSTAQLAPMIERAWDLPALTERYRTFIAAFAPYASAQLSERDSCLVRTQLAHVFRGFVMLDPELPDDATETPEWRTRAVDLFRGLYAELEPPALRYFDAQIPS